MTSSDGSRAIRESVALSRPTHLRHLRLCGAHAHEALDRLCACELRVRDGQMLQTLFLDEDARCVADVYIAADDEDFIVLADVADAATFDAHLARHISPDLAVEIDDRSTSHAALSLDGPYAWELLAAGLGQEVVGMPYLSLFHVGPYTCYRAGRTGEYGYGVIGLPAEVDALEVTLRAEGGAIGMADAELDDVDRCALENWFFNIRREGREPVTPIELQLQWRVSHRKSGVGAEALRRRRTEGAKERLTTLVGPGPYAIGDAVRLHGEQVGRIVNADRSDSRGDWVALALIAVAWAQPGIDAFRVRHDGTDLPARSVSPPVLNNRSLWVSPQLHSYVMRSELVLPPLARG